MLKSCQTKQQPDTARSEPKSEDPQNLQWGHRGKAPIVIVDLAAKVGLSAKAVAQRIKRLKAEKIITGFGIGLGLNKIGYEYFKLHLRFKTFDKKRFEEMIEFARFHPNIVFTNELIGGDDLELDIYIESTEAYHKVLNEIRYKFSDVIKDFESFKYFKELKHNLFPRKA
jgi:DNA-binding Lrp family transcriptional regulator